MAIKIEKELDIGITLKDAYCRIDTVNGYKKNIQITVNTYVSREAFLNNASYVDQKIFSFEPSVAIGSENFIKQGYEYLKTLPQYENAVNVPLGGNPD